LQCVVNKLPMLPALHARSPVCQRDLFAQLPHRFTPLHSRCFTSVRPAVHRPRSSTAVCLAAAADASSTLQDTAQPSPVSSIINQQQHGSTLDQPSQVLQNQQEGLLGPVSTPSGAMGAGAAADDPTFEADRVVERELLDSNGGCIPCKKQQSMCKYLRTLIIVPGWCPTPLVPPSLCASPAVACTSNAGDVPQEPEQQRCKPCVVPLCLVCPYWNRHPHYAYGGHL
jgi:hypothetical protein